MERLLITAHLKSNPIIYNNLYLDGILHHFEHERINEIMHRPHKPNEPTLKVIIPIKRQGDVYLCSKARYKPLKKYINKWRKRFDIQHAEKWKDKQKFRVDSTKTKNYNMPVEVTICKDNKVSWIVVGDKEKITKLLTNVHGIGKKNSQGYGLVEKWTIEKTERLGVRHFPVMLKSGLPDKEITEYTTYNPPYSVGQKRLCVIRKF
jgi:CRISPR type IV-associated protein Csf3